ncbi:MAG TPA: TerB family tellurite resistance protein [Polyangiaceae bacterium]|nr:TerB family tellurite resistance protein [Polyangiaceae bacterium]
MKPFSNRTTIDSDQLLEQAVTAALPAASTEQVRIITAVVGLIGAVAYADRSITEQEVLHLRAELARIVGFSADHVDAVAQLLTKHALRLSATFVPRLTRTLRENLDIESRREVLDALLAMAAADGVITHEEVINVRNLCTALGLSQSDYNQVQAKYRDRLSSLRH